MDNAVSVAITEMQSLQIPQAQRAQIRQSSDYVRHATIALALRRIEADEVVGDLAEVGVYKGYTSKYLHLIAPEILYLFDTFQGFPDEEPTALLDSKFRDTSVEEVLNNIGRAENIVIRKGYFPDTAHGLEDKKFSMVILDLDKYKPTLAGWEFFYPRVSVGGFIFVHDYNNGQTNPCRAATDEFLRGKQERLVELPDVWGSGVLRKIG
jgi:O-methyltransferase